MTLGTASDVWLKMRKGEGIRWMAVLERCLSEVLSRKLK